MRVRSHKFCGREGEVEIWVTLKKIIYKYRTPVIMLSQHLKCPEWKVLHLHWFKNLVLIALHATVTDSCGKVTVGHPFGLPAHGVHRLD